MLKNVFVLMLMIATTFTVTLREVTGQKVIGAVSFSDDSLKVMEQFNSGKSIMLYNKAIASINSGDYRLAIRNLSEASALAGGMADALYNRAVANIGMNNPVEAMLDFAEAIQIDPKPVYYISRSLLFLHRGDTTSAVSDVQKALNASGDETELLLIAGMIQIRTKNYEDARESFSKVYNAAPSNTQALNGLAAAAIAAGDTASAIANLKLSLNTNSNQLSVNYFLGQILLDRNQLIESSDIFKKVVIKIPDDAKALNALAIIYLRMELTDSAKLWCEKATEADPRYPQAWNTHGNIEQKLNNLTRAEADYSMAVSLNPELYEAYYNRALVRIRLRNDSGACSDLKIALDNGIKEAEVSYRESCE